MVRNSAIVHLVRVARARLVATALLICIIAAFLFSPGDQLVSAATAGTIHYPDMQTVLPPADFKIVRPTPTTREFRYTHLTANLGDGPLELRMQYDPVTDTSRPFQRLYTHNSAGTWSVQREVPVVGTFEYHPLHGHYHFPLAKFGLYNVATDGSVGSAAIMSPKIGFCLGDSVTQDRSLQHYGAFFYSGSECSNPTQTEGISVGSADLYDLNDAGQSIDITNLPDGEYWFRAISDPYNYFAETNEANNITDIKMRITGTTVTLLGSAVQPNSLPPTVTMVTPAAGTVSGTVSLNANATDASGIASVQFLLDGYPIGPPLTSAPFTFAWNSATTGNGSHYLSALARAGTTFNGSAAAVLVTVSNTGAAPPPPPSAPVANRLVTVNATGTATTAAFNSVMSGELLVAFVSAAGPSGQTANVTGGGLQWTLVSRANGRAGTSEIWRARAPSAMNNVTVSSTLNANAAQTLAVVGFLNGAIGASTSAGAPNGSPTASLATTQPDARVYGVGNDVDAAIARVPATGQSIIQQWVNTSAGATLWIQAMTSTIPVTGTPAALIDNTPTANQWNFAAVEIVPAVVISNPVVINRTPSSAKVTWTTNVPATSTVAYGTTTNYGNQATDSSLVTNHQITVTGLQPETTYHYQIRSQDGTGQGGATVDFIFGTPAISDITCSIVSPTNGSIVADTITVAAEAHSTASVAGVQFLLNNSNLGPEAPGAVQTTEWDTKTVWNGDHVLSAIARDPTGNTAVALPVTVKVNNLSDPVSVATQHNDAARTGANLSETILSTSNVNVGRFGKLFERTVDDEIWGQPLYVPNVDVTGVGLRNLVYVTTANDSVYAFDADNPSATAPIWHRSYVDPANSIIPGNRSDFACTNFAGHIGIVGTPVIDLPNRSMYFVTRTKENGGYVQRLHGVDIRDGSELPTSPVLIQATVAGTGINFDAALQNQRAALLLSNGVVYIAWGSLCETAPFHGWVLGYETTQLQQVVSVNTTPNGSGAGIWQSGQGLSADPDGNIYAITGTGSFNGDTNGQDYANSVLKLAPNGTLLDWFTPFNVNALNLGNLDLGSQGALPLPNTNLVIGGGKEGKLYVLNRDNMGHFQPGADDQIVQTLAVSPGQMDASPVYWEGGSSGPSIYVWPANDRLKAFRLATGAFDTTPASQSTVTSTGAPGGVLSLSANGSTSGSAIVWASASNGGDATLATQPAILRAFDAADVAHELWNSEQNATRDRVGTFSKHSAPTVANGKVFVPTFSNKVVVYGLLPPSSLIAVPTVVNTTQSSATAAILAAGLSVGHIADGSSVTVPAGSIVNQSPTAGALVAVGTPVDLVVSTGPPPVALPSVVGATQSKATSDLSAVGLLVGTTTTAYSATTPSGSVISQNPPAGMLVPIGSRVDLVISAGPTPVGVSVDRVVFSDGLGALTTAPFSTTAPGEVLFAFAASDGPSSGQTLSVSGGGLGWTLVRRVNAQAGTSEIWKATASGVLNNVTVSATQSSANYYQSLTVVAFIGAAGSGATGGASASTGAPTVTVTTTQPGSLLYAVGNDWDRALARTLPSTQALVHQYLPPAGDTLWVQNRIGTIANAGVAVQMNDTAPTTDRWNLAAVEILASSQAPATVNVPNVVGQTQQRPRRSSPTPDSYPVPLRLSPVPRCRRDRSLVRPPVLAHRSPPIAVSISSSRAVRHRSTYRTSSGRRSRRPPRSSPTPDSYLAPSPRSPVLPSRRDR